MEVKGKIKFIGETQTFGNNGFQKREVVITTDEQYPQHISISFTQDKCIVLDKYKVGDYVSIGINLRGREWANPQGEVKYFNEINGWKIEGVEGGKDGNVPHPSTSVSGASKDDLPF